jgi:hypothetical protein
MTNVYGTWQTKRRIHRLAMPFNVIAGKLFLPKPIA